MKVLHIEVVLLAVLVVNQVYCSKKVTCPVGEVKHKNRCYKIETEALTWDAAKDACEGEGKILVEITSKAEDMFVRKISFMDNANFGHWTGGKGNNGTYRWVGTNRLMSYTDWAYGEPYLIDGCVALLKDRAKWTTTDCHGYSRSICETKETRVGI